MTKCDSCGNEIVEGTRHVPATTPDGQTIAPSTCDVYAGENLRGFIRKREPKANE